MNVVMKMLRARVVMRLLKMHQRFQVVYHRVLRQKRQPRRTSRAKREFHPQRQLKLQPKKKSRKQRRRPEKLRDPSDAAVEKTPTPDAGAVVEKPSDETETKKDVPDSSAVAAA